LNQHIEKTPQRESLWTRPQLDLCWFQLTATRQALDEVCTSAASPYDVAHDSLSFFACKVLGKKLRGLQDICGSCPFAKIFSQVPPAHDTRGVNQKFRRASNVLPVRTAGPVQQIIAANDFRFGIR